MMRTWITAFSVCSLAACGHHGAADDGDISMATLTIDPPTSELLILNSVAANEDFSAKLTFPDGHTKDVTADTAFLVDGAYGSFNLNHLAMGVAGKAKVFGTYVDKNAEAEVIARLKSIRVDPSLDPNTPDLFTGPEDPSRAPTVVYPPADVVIPRNLGDFETHWIDASGNDVFEVSLHTEFSDVRVYVPGGNGVAGVGPMPSWISFAPTEWISAVGVEGSIQYQVRGVQRSSPGPVGAGVLRTAKLSNEELLGGLYYWAAGAATGGSYGIFRHDMSHPGQPAEEYMTTNQTSGRCVACHVLSRDGTRMAITYDGGNGAATLLDVGTKVAQPTVNKWNFGTFTPDGTQFLSVEAGVLAVRDATSQAVLMTMPGGAISHPDLSADGTSLVYVHPSGAASDWSFGGGSIYTRSYDQTTHTFGAEVPLVMSNGDNNYYPSYSPDGQWVVFNKGSGSSYNGVDASVWVVKADGSLPPVAMTTANVGLGLTNSWARWAPFQQTTGLNHEPLFWITVSTKRDFGTRLKNTGLAEGNKFPQIWMYPFYPGRMAAGSDPSAAAFRLPFQNLTSRNHIAQWTERVVVTQ